MTREKDKKIGRERIKILLKEAEEVWEDKPELSKRYVRLAEKIGQKIETPLPTPLKKKYCDNCKQILIDGKNCKIRISKENIVKICEECGYKNTYKIEENSRV